MNQDSGGNPHITLGESPTPDQRIEDIFVLVATTPEGGQGIYGQKIDDHMFNFVAENLPMKDTLEDFLRSRGSIEAARRSGIKLEWVSFSSNERTEIT